MLLLTDLFSVSVNLVMARKKGVLDATVTTLARFRHTSITADESVHIHFILFFTQNSRQDMKETNKTTRNIDDICAIPVRTQNVTTGPCSMSQIRPSQPLNFLRAKTVWYIM